MSTTFHHKVDSVEGLTVTFRSRKLHPDAGVAWPWHHAMLVLGTIGYEENPIAQALGDGLFRDDVLRARHTEFLASVEQKAQGKTKWITTVTFTAPTWMSKALAKDFTWESAA